jgi:pSer/pThr/pTyr-binding forkhead associated (FHA) protein
MQKCVNCGHENRPGVMFCENCGASLADEAPMETKSIDASTEDEKAELGVEESMLLDVRVQGTAIFQEKDLLRLDIEGSSEPIVLKPEAETIFGRRDPATGAMPDVDLTPFAGYRMGVSRRHAAIRFGDEQILNLWDLGSSNGTYLNGERLNAHRPYRLHDGDELRLGQMMIRVHFQSPSATPQPPGETAESDVWVEAKDEKAAEASPAKPVETETNIYKTPAASVEKRAGISPEKPPEESKPIELGPSKEQPVKPAASTEPPADLPDGVITLSPATGMPQKPVTKVEKPEPKPVEKSEPPPTVSFEDEQHAELDAQAAPPTATEKETEATDQKPEKPEKPEADSAVPPAKPENESQDKEKRD